MALVPHKVVALNELNEGTKNTISGAVVSLFDTDGNAVTLFDDEAGSNGSTAKQTDSEGVVVVYVTAGEYDEQVNGGIQRRVTVGGNWVISYADTASLENSRPNKTGQRAENRERANAQYELAPSGYTAQSGDVVAANGRVWALVIKSVTHMKWFGVSPDNTAAENDARLAEFIERVIDEGVTGFLDAGTYLISDTIQFSGSNMSFTGNLQASARWDAKTSVTSFVYTGGASKDLMVIGAKAGSPSENNYISNFAIYPQTDFKCNRGIVIDGSTSIVGTRSYFRGSVFDNIATQKCGGAGIETLGNVFDIQLYNPSSRKNRGACFKTTESTVVLGLVEADQVDIFAPMFYALSQETGALAYPDAWSLDARGTNVYGGNFQGSLGAKCRYATTITGTHIEDDQGAIENNDNTIGVMVAGRHVHLSVKFIVGYGTGLLIGNPYSTGDTCECTTEIGLIDGKAIPGSVGIETLPGGNRRSGVNVQRVLNCDTPVQDTRGINDVRFNIAGSEFSSYQTLSSSSGSVSVGDYSRLRLFSSSAVTLTDFTGGRDGQQVVIIITDNNTTMDFTSGNLRGNGGVNYSASAGDTLLATYNSNLSAWLCSIISI